MLTVLCIDDDLQCLSLREQSLQSAGFNVLTAPDGQAGLVMAKQHNIDIVVLDYLMPEMNGEEVARLLRQEHPSLRIILCSGCDKIPESVFGVVDAFVTKGDGVEFLISVIRELSKRKQSDSKTRQSFDKTA